MKSGQKDKESGLLANKREREREKTKKTKLKL